MDNLEGIKVRVFPLWVLAKFDCTLLWGLLYFSFVKWSAVSLHNYPTALSRTLRHLTSLSILNASWQGHWVIYLFIVTSSNRSLSSGISDASPKERGIKETSKFNQRPAASASVAAAVSLLTGIWRPCVQIGSKEKRSTARGCELSLSGFWVPECSPSHEYQGQPASIIHNPAVLRCPYLHLYCRTSKWLFLFNIVAASPLWLLQLKDQPELLWGKKKSVHWWVAG